MTTKPKLTPAAARKEKEAREEREYLQYRIDTQEIVLEWLDDETSICNDCMDNKSHAEHDETGILRLALAIVTRGIQFDRELLTELSPASATPEVATSAATNVIPLVTASAVKKH
ncbi:MAG: hypothetical protein WD051_14005 [Steroidobacteraceae bacterium]